MSKSGLGFSAGIPGLRYSVHTSGRTTKTLSVPGTGLGYQSRSGGGRGGGSHSRASGGGRAATAQPASWALPSVGFLASKAEKAYREGIVAAFVAKDDTKAASLFEQVLASDPRVPSAHLLAALALEGDAAITHLETLIESDDPMPDKYQFKYLPPLTLNPSITENMRAEVPFSPIGAALILAERYQEASRLEEAIGLIQQLHEVYPNDPVVRLSLADLLYADGDLDGTVEVTTGAGNDDDVGVALLHLRASALFGLGQLTGSLDTFKAALAKTAGRDPGLQMAVRYDRAIAYAEAGQAAKARADWERLYAADPHYRDVAERVRD